MTRPDARGVSLLELLVALAVLAGVLAVVAPLFGLVRASWSRQQQSAERMQQLRAAVLMLAAELAEAGRGRAPDETAIVRAQPQEVQFRRDGRTVRYRLAPAAGGLRLLRSLDGGTNEVAEGLAGLRLSYVDAAGRPAIPEEDPAVVRITAWIDIPPGRGGRRELAAEVRLRNGRDG
jgi:prepilin-type N-terminal cleavage/methylation domain-containing protein